MLVLTRKEGEQIRIGENIVISVVRTAGDRVRIGIEAPKELTVLRSELCCEDKTGTEEKSLSAILAERPKTEAIPFERVVPQKEMVHCS